MPPPAKSEKSTCSPYAKFKKMMLQVRPDLEEYDPKERNDYLRELWKNTKPSQRLGFCNNKAELTRARKALSYIQKEKTNKKIRLTRLCNHAKLKSIRLKKMTADDKKYFDYLIRTISRNVKRPTKKTQK